MGVRWRRVVLGLGLAIWMVLGWGQVPAALAMNSEQALIAEVWRLVNRAYLDETFNHQNWWFMRERALKRSLPSRDVTYDVIRDMLATLDDPYTRLLPPSQYRSLQTSTSGELIGVGLQISKASDGSGWLEVIAPVEGSPAEGAGIAPRDLVVAIDGTSTTDLTLDEAANRMRGQRGTAISLTLRHRQDSSTYTVELTRDVIDLDPVYADLRWEGDVQVGYLRLSQFNGNASASLADTLHTMESAGAMGYILDLRNNPGGLLQAGVDIARLWLDRGVIVYTVSRQGILDSFDAYGPALTDAPLVVLVNTGTASASEILAGALQDNGRAELVGEVTFGKGLIQSLFDLSDGAGLAVTVAKYETPAHRDINQLGIQPDVEVDAPLLMAPAFGTEADPQYRAAVERVQQLVMRGRA